MHLYVHVPFCARRCSYCDFAIAVRRAVPSDAYVDAVLAEWTARLEEAPWRELPALDTVYLGGGTPSRLAPEAIGRLISGVAARRPIAPGAEITLEANPDDVTSAAASAWRAAGVNRISLGVQSFDPRVLDWMHRTHRADQVPTAVDTLRAAGLDNISLDLIFALPASLGRRWDDDLESALALAPQHLSLYGLTVEPRTPLGRWAERGEPAVGDEDAYAREFLATHARLAAEGWDHYEVSNASRPGRRAVHNAAYWRRAPFLGLGPSAHSGAGAERWWNVREWEAYRAAPASSRVAGREKLDGTAVRLEELYLGLRTREGLARERLHPADVAAWTEAGWAVGEGERVRLTAEGWLRLDGLAGAARDLA